MKVFIIGGGGREHVLAWKLAQSAKVSQVLAHPMNGGLAELAEPAPLKRSATAYELARFAEKEGVDLTVVGPEALLCVGIADTFASRGLRLFGPTQKASQIEGSKVWTKKFLRRYRIPTAEFEIFRDYERALNYVMAHEYPVVIKADGLAAGKGVTVAKTPKEAKEALHGVMVEGRFGSAGNQVVVEECLVGQEASMLVFTDGENLLPLLPAQDHKPLLDGDQGPNTGGMGAICPTPLVDGELQKKVLDEVFHPVLRGFSAEGIRYVGMLYAGLMIDGGQAKVLEFNCRFGDPETQAILPLLDSDLVDLIEATLDGRLNEVKVNWRENKTCVSVVMASGGYPGKYEKNLPIEGLKQFDPEDRDTIVFHAGTQRAGQQVLTSGGRVLAVTAVGDDPADARQRAYAAVEQIHFEAAQYRKDIGAKALG